ncbi:hypothetical protein OQJ18_08095 [Fluoribacter dumoffii]|uniref:Uncharacterized protein n=1 Tax=Fluoribacter dumoffii TaxID=463 RepID=A0A377G8G7_9GAMM|nr:hypothetical protein [Fluoribacter dumoffii]KTC89689.1 hypothetical protein Ldum_0757 [Fluoribacter dumoffii NY 23]MCW8384883.1 hypothetical protein [Fluoribacter dumoffii]MCW8417945.1 hypothetical protein [Fluoribacter dumoffii]MCW8454213.1 hypothetical protein [Fluoribacter dumoffii]MCW8461713.1 hypothetical protein [Fluoribacter dumoffii]
MKEFIQSNPHLNHLIHFIKEKGISPSTPPAREKERKTEEALSDKQQNFIENRAARIIQGAYRASKLKQKIRSNPYKSYLSLMDEAEAQRVPANILFGRHVAEIRTPFANRINNPYIYAGARYHRDDDLSGTLLDCLLDSFNIDGVCRALYEYVPVTLLENTPLEEIIKRYFPKVQKTKNQPRIIKDPKHSIALVAVPQGYYRSDEMKSILSICGLIASPWEIAINVKNPPYPLVEPEKIPSGSCFPTTKEALLKSKLFNKLLLIAKSPKHATNKLALAVKQLLTELPELNEHAIQRISRMLHLTCLFYGNNYSQFAFCLYTIVHEISLSLLNPKNMGALRDDFSRFSQETQKGLLHALGLKQEQLTATTFFASLAMSGTNAYVIAMHLAQKMKTKTHKKPKIKIFGTNYYEFDFLTKESKSSDADIFVLCSGPMVMEKGLIPGIDINCLIKEEVIHRGRKKPLTVVIDTTTTLYKNLHLDPDVQNLVKEGALSLIIHESLQKFGLLHTDQAQCGKVFGLCSTEFFDEEVFKELQQNALIDFINHVDLRIGAYISSNCSQVLEEIKQQHFVNGALLKNMLTRANLIEPQVVKHPYMLSNPEELYFVNFDPEKAKSIETATNIILESRDSFGHFCSTRSSISDFDGADELEQTRLSMDASDTIDCFIQISQIYLANFYDTEEWLDILLENARKSDSLSYEEQIISVALINNLVDQICLNPSRIIKNQVELFAAMCCIIDQCYLLKGRQYYGNASCYLQKLKNELVEFYQPKNQHHFIQSIKRLYFQGTQLTANVLEQLKLEQEKKPELKKTTYPFFQSAATMPTASAREDANTRIHTSVVHKF